MDQDWDEVGILGPWVEMCVLVDPDQVLLLPSVPRHVMSQVIEDIFTLCIYVVLFLNCDSCKCADLAVLQCILKSVSKQTCSINLYYIIHSLYF